MVNETQIQLALADLKAQSNHKYRPTAKKYGVDRNTLKRRHELETASYTETHSKGQSLLTNGEEALLIEHIEKLADRGILYSPQIIENLAVGIAKRSLGGRWVERFIKRHQDQLKSIYIRNIDHARKIADNSRDFEHYFNLVCVTIVSHDLRIGMPSHLRAEGWGYLPQDTLSVLSFYTLV